MKGRRSAVRTTRVVRWRGGTASRARDSLAVEEPLEIRLAWHAPDGAPRTETLAVTMRTPGHDFELVAGFLHGEGVVRDPGQVASLRYCRGGAEPQEYNVVEARLARGVAVDMEGLRRNFLTSSSCGVCGRASIEALLHRGWTAVSEPPPLTEALLSRLPEVLRAKQTHYRRTGGLHAAGDFDAQGEARAIREDVGRHNAVDKVTGAALLAGGLPATGRLLVISGRASFDIVQKAVAAGFGAVVAVGAPSTLAVELARRFRLTLVGFVRDGGFNVYANGGRVA